MNLTNHTNEKLFKLKESMENQIHENYIHTKDYSATKEYQDILIDVLFELKIIRNIDC